MMDSARVVEPPEEKGKITAQRASMRYDAVFDLVSVKRFTKCNLFRVIYSDSNGDLISANALKLKHSFSFRKNSPECQGWIEILYLYIDSVHGTYINRSQVFLETNGSSSDCYIQQEHLLSSIDVRCLDVLINLFCTFQDDDLSMNLTHLRKLATSKNLSGTSQVVANGLRHVISVQLWTKTVLLVHQCFNQLEDGKMLSCEYLIKNDILSYIDFFKITDTILKLENGAYFGCGYNEDMLYTNLAKLSAISDNFANVRPVKRTKRAREEKEEEEEEGISYETSSSLLQDLGNLYNDEEEFF